MQLCKFLNPHSLAWKKTTTVMLRAAIYYIMSQEQLYLNILDPQYARYIDLRHDLQEYLEEMYGNDIDFGISVSEPRGKTPFVYFFIFSP
jgi:hypothetical protein